MTFLVWALVVGALLVATVVVSCIGRARRLDRLHVRTDAARDGLHHALDRRAAAAVGCLPALRGPGAAALRTALDARTGLRPPPGDGRAETVENTLTRALAGVDRSGLPTGPAAELTDAEQLVVLARRVHNDAVRDTLGLRSRRLVRWLHLAGTAPVPEYFEIADPDVGRSTSAAAPSDPVY
ncbi:NUDIX hydrolase [Pseudonocardia sp. N23]|uniref:NUDIX hydrolase n=1 Tax=Pseudonocardia sp. N23 TaxID=1987376 RepID=UPI000BFB848D|nr:NUDIX hydrolase [Pseudonocardia sp. N23]GAY11658.1 membrane domain/dihydroneopterin triphosphate pyrophosphohydrolase [Pseudonocardia sp. N23]